MGSNTGITTYREDGLGHDLCGLSFRLCTAEVTICALGSTEKEVGSPKWLSSLSHLTCESAALPELGDAFVDYFWLKVIYGALILRFLIDRAPTRK